MREGGSPTTLGEDYPVRKEDSRKGRQHSKGNTRRLFPRRREEGGFVQDNPESISLNPEINQQHDSAQILLP